MSTPVVSASRFAASLALGLLMGIWYEFLRPLALRRPILSDLIFLPGAFWIWLLLMFGICRGDLRISFFIGLLLGWLLWEITLGVFVRPLFSFFWKGIACLIALAAFLPKKIFKK